MVNEDIIFTLILHSGDARSFSMQALKLARENKFEEAMELLNQANLEINKAHKMQMSLIHEEVEGKKVDLSLLMIHAQDHLMSSMTVKELAKEMVLMKQEMRSEYMMK